LVGGNFQIIANLTTPRDSVISLIDLGMNVNGSLSVQQGTDIVIVGSNVSISGDLEGPFDSSLIISLPQDTMATADPPLQVGGCVHFSGRIVLNLTGSSISSTPQPGRFEYPLIGAPNAGCDLSQVTGLSLIVNRADDCTEVTKTGVEYKRSQAVAILDMNTVHCLSSSRRLAPLTAVASSVALLAAVLF